MQDIADIGRLLHYADETTRQKATYALVSLGLTGIGCVF